jgi:hypothetical protein
MAAGSTYTPIATVSTSASSYTFNSFSGYTDLVLIGHLRSTKTTANSDTLFIQYNSDTGTNYSHTRIVGNGSSVSSARQTDQNQLALPEIASDGDTSGIFTPVIHNVMNYSNSTTNKTSITRTSNSTIGPFAIVGLYRSTSAITSIKIYPASGDFVSGSTLTLYGILAA